MIVVKVELWSLVANTRREIARMTIEQTNGDNKIGEYRVRTYRGKSSLAFDNAIVDGRFQREGRVTGHQRLVLHAWHLVGKALASVRYGSQKENMK